MPGVGSYNHGPKSSRRLAGRAILARSPHRHPSVALDVAFAEPTGGVRMVTIRPRRRLAALAVLAAAVVLVTGTLAVTHPWSSGPSCPAVAEHPDWSVARRW